MALGLEIHMDTGFRTGARRTSVDDYIELRADGGWPLDERFYYDVVSRDAGRLIASVTGYENNSTGEPYVAQAVVFWMGESAAHLEHVEMAGGVTTDLDAPEIAAAGFRLGPDGRRAGDTNFLDEDPAGAARLLESVLTAGERWGQDRDAAGRYLPETRAGRLWHRLKHGPSGAPLRR